MSLSIQCSQCHGVLLQALSYGLDAQTVQHAWCVTSSPYGEGELSLIPNVLDFQQLGLNLQLLISRLSDIHNVLEV